MIMKDIKEIVARAIILLTISDRCALESSVAEGKSYSMKQREDQRLAMISWLERNGYYEYMTENEIYFMRQAAGKGDNAMEMQFQYEAIEALLWSLGLVKKLSSYDQYVLDDFHPVLQISDQHTYEKLEKSCMLRSEREISLQNKIAMLWYWRVIEGANPLFYHKSLKQIIVDAFGEEYGEILLQISGFNNEQNDFIVKRKKIAELSEMELEHLKKRAQWRYHAFEWMLSGMSWDEVELNT